MVRRAVEAGELTLHGWHYVIEDGDVHVFDAQRAAFIPASVATHIGAGPYGGTIQPP
jgi:carbonic anhydrase